MVKHHACALIVILISVVLVVSPVTLLVTSAQNNTSGQSDKLSTTPEKTGSANGIGQSIFEDKAITLGNNIKNVVILIPNEGHESPTLPEEQRQINQPYVPQNIVVNPGTNIVWLNGDVGHEHTITLNDDNSQKVYDSGKFDFNTVSIPLELNKTGKFTYSEANVNVDDPKYVMEGTITVKDTIPSLHNLTSDTIGFFMIPAKDSNKHIPVLTDSGINVIDKYTFKDLRGGQKGTGPNEMLLLVGAKDKQNLISTLEKITPDLPYS
jgi:plastocyanin